MDLKRQTQRAAQAITYLAGLAHEDTGLRIAALGELGNHIKAARDTLQRDLDARQASLIEGALLSPSTDEET